ncbi:MAG: hypothetical protein ACP6IS_10385 [Candidatus Asgardarchaeia archaeon]
MFYIYVSTVILALYALYILFLTKRTYSIGKPLSTKLSFGWWVMDVGWSGLVVISAITNLWTIAN